MIKEIKKIIKAQQQLTKKALVLYTEIVEEIIKTQSTDQNHIEHTLDGILNFGADDDMLLLYKKLCRYYYYINPQATVDYVNIYREMWDDDSIDNKKDVK
jgi:hypothetical protein